MEDEIVLMDMKGRDIRRLFEADKVHDLVTNGVMSFDTPRRRYWFVNGRFMHEDVYYSVATTNVITNGPLKEHFRWAFKVNNRFVLHENGRMKRSKDGQPVALREFMIHEILIPLLGNVSLNVGADFFFFKGKTAVNSEPGLSMRMRVGVTYNRR